MVNTMIINKIMPNFTESIRKLFFVLIPVITIFFFCAENIFSQNITYHLFQFEGKVGIVSSEGEITLEPTFDNRTYYINGFDHTDSKYLLINNNETFTSELIDVTGKKYFTNIDKIRYDNNGQFAVYYDDDDAKTGLHIMSIPEEKEVMYFKDKVNIAIHGRSEYFFSVVHNGKWKIYNSQFRIIYELAVSKEIDVIEEKNTFLALAVSNYRGDQVVYIDKEGNILIGNKTTKLKPLFQKILKKRLEEDDFQEDWPSAYMVVPDKINAMGYEKVEGKKYNSGIIRYIITKNGLQGVLNENGQLLIEPVYSKIDVIGGSFKTMADGKYGVCDVDGKLIFRPVFQNIRYEPLLENYLTTKNYIDVVYNGYVFEATLDGRIFAPKGMVFD